MNRKRTVKRVPFNCSKCGTPTDLSPEHYRRCVREGRPLMCPECVDARRKISLAKSRKKLPRAIYHCEECGVPRSLTTMHAERHKALGKRILCATCNSRLYHQSVSKAAQYGANGQWAHRRKETIKVNGCTLVAARNGRCKVFLDCSGYSECLCAVVEKGWMGWRAR